jgi:FMN phosphatase YigB (HAD superfamily)
MAIKHFILDFDGTCTQIPLMYQAYLDQYFVGLNTAPFPEKFVEKPEWEIALQQVREHSPMAGWTVTSTPAAPAAADPFILAFEAAKFLLRQKKSTISEPPLSIHVGAYNAHPAPWRPEARVVFNQLLQREKQITILTNSATASVSQRLLDLMGGDRLPEGMDVVGDAAKFSIADVRWDQLDPNTQITETSKQRFRKLPAAAEPLSDRPIYLRRASFFEKICRILNNRFEAIEETVFCGDIWELDLAMPLALGFPVHLIQRALPFATYEYELAALTAAGAKGKTSDDLTGLLRW